MFILLVVLKWQFELINKYHYCIQNPILHNHTCWETSVLPWYRFIFKSIKALVPQWPLPPDPPNDSNLDFWMFILLVDLKCQFELINENHYCIQSTLFHKYQWINCWMYHTQIPKDLKNMNICHMTYKNSANSIHMASLLSSIIMKEYSTNVVRIFIYHFKLVFLNVKQNSSLPTRVVHAEWFRNKLIQQFFTPKQDITMEIICPFTFKNNSNFTQNASLPSSVFMREYVMNAVMIFIYHFKLAF